MAGTSAANTAPPGPISSQIAPTQRRHPRTAEPSGPDLAPRLPPQHEAAVHTPARGSPIPGTTNPSAAAAATARGGGRRRHGRRRSEKGARAGGWREGMWVRFWVWCAVEVEGGRGGETELSGSLVGAGLCGRVGWRRRKTRERWFGSKNFELKKLGVGGLCRLKMEPGRWERTGAGAGSCAQAQLHFFLNSARISCALKGKHCILQPGFFFHVFFWQTHGFSPEIDCSVHVSYSE